MKKKLTSLFIALSMLTSTAAFAATPESAESIGIIGGADGPTEVYISEAPFDVYHPNPNPKIIFNDSELAAQFGIEGAAYVYYNSEYLDPAIIIGSRTMLPFRSFLEAVGATVSYDDATRTASAVKKDTTVSFNLDSEIIHVTSEDGSKELKMDVKPVIIEGHSYVPIRFLSEAFGMQVGWSSYEQTAVIADFEAYLDELWANCPNLSKLMELGITVPERSYSVSSADFVFNTETFYGGYADKNYNHTDTIILELSLDTEGTTVGMEADSKSTASVKYSDSEGNTLDLSSCALDIIFKNNTYYIRTNILSALATKGIIDANDIPPSLLNSETWYEISLENYFALLSSYSGEAVDTEAVTKLMDNATDPKAIVEYVLNNMEEANSIAELNMVTQMFDTFATLDKYIIIESPSENVYDVSFKFDIGTLFEVIYTNISESDNLLGYEITDEELNELMNELNQELDGLVFDASITSHIENGVTTSQKAYLNFSFEDGTDKLKLLLNVTSTVDPKANVADIEAPENAVDILSKIYGL